MRVHLAVVLLGILCLLAPAVSADISRISPSSFTPSGEDFITIFGSNLAGTAATLVVFDGSISVEPQFAGADRLIVWVPVEVLIVEGQHCLVVQSIDSGGTRTHGPACFNVVQPDNGGGGGPPVLDLPEIVSAEAKSANGTEVTFEVAAFDDAGAVPVSCSPASGSVFPIGTRTVTCSATNAAGTSSGSFLVIVSDTTPPVVTVPNDIESGNPVVTFTATAVDNVDGTLSVSCTPPSGATFHQGNTRVVCTATDAHLNTGFGIFRVKITGGPPQLILPDDVVEEATGPNGAVVTYAASTEENGPVNCSPPSGSTFAIGTTTVTCTASSSGGTSTGSFKVTVQDTTPPLITAPAVVNAEATSPNGNAQVVFVVTAQDAVDGDRPVTCTPPSASAFVLGTTDVVCTASDTRNNSDSIAFQVIVSDTTAPAVTLISASPAALWPPDHKMVNVTVKATVVDAVDPAPAWQIVSVSSNQPVNGTGDGDTAPDWVITGPATLQLRAERSGNKERVYTITVQTKDSAGNVGSGFVLVRVTDTKKRSVSF